MPIISNAIKQNAGLAQVIEYILEYLLSCFFITSLSSFSMLGINTVLFKINLHSVRELNGGSFNHVKGWGSFLLA